jgi:hypothetical protein
MNSVKRAVILTGLMGMTTSAMAADFDGSKSLICASQAANECIAGKHCGHVAPASINIPDFFDINVKDKVITGTAAKTPIERVEHLDGKLVLQGADDGVEGVRDGIGWTMTIDEESGKMSLSALGDGFAVVVFGACMVR